MADRIRLEDELMRGFHEVFRKIKRDLKEALGDGRNLGDFAFLRHLYSKGPQKVSDLSAEFDVTNSHVTQQTDRLVKKGWVDRERSHMDKRVVELKITKEGIQVFLEMDERRKAYFKREFNSLSTGELETLLHLFHKLLH
ncbi:MarR family winged helix-turn-helix transcriptional regulator [Salinithrix halophila]|uniref:MarR family winged helix-turn-helix transcriptional regulator n=1 Tax=Salinithrix halophila TaxID=1485204 RepID=A0ABV8JA22_9BACL